VAIADEPVGVLHESIAIAFDVACALFEHPVNGDHESVPLALGGPVLGLELDDTGFGTGALLAAECPVRHRVGMALRLIRKALGKLAHTSCGGGVATLQVGETALVVARVTAWTASELRRFLDHVSDDRWFALWRLAATTGMRRGELAGLTWRALDLDGARLTVEQQMVASAGGPTLGPPKSTRSRRTIAVDPGTVRALVEHREAQKVERALGGDAYVDHDAVFADALDGPLSPQQLTHWFARERRAAGIPAGSLHVLRHTAATLALTSGVRCTLSRLGSATTPKRCCPRTRICFRSPTSSRQSGCSGARVSIS
jgi:integrase